MKIMSVLFFSGDVISPMQMIMHAGWSEDDGGELAVDPKFMTSLFNLSIIGILCNCVHAMWDLGFL